MKVVIDGNMFYVIKTCLKHFQDVTGIEIGEDKRGYGYIKFLRGSN